MKRNLMPYGSRRSAIGFGSISREERDQSDLFYADLMGYARARRRQRRWPAEADESWAEGGPLIEGPLTDGEWRTVADMLKRGEADVGEPLTSDASRNALLAAARIFCARNALNLGPGDPLICLKAEVTIGDPRVRALVPHVTARGPIGDWAVLMRAIGLTVNESPGWRTRTKPDGGFEPIGVMIHHTARVGAGLLADLVDNIKCHFFVDPRGVMTIVAGGRAHHAGPGAQQVLDEVRKGVAPSGSALQRGLRDSTSGNSHFYGFENENKGDGTQPWPDVQMDTIVRGAAALCKRHAWTANRVIGHKEWTKRKPVDPSFDMDAFRARVAALLN